jgi:hypothetical protein
MEASNPYNAHSTSAIARDIWPRTIQYSSIKRDEGGKSMDELAESLLNSQWFEGNQKMT